MILVFIFVLSRLDKIVPRFSTGQAPIFLVASFSIEFLNLSASCDYKKQFVGGNYGVIFLPVVSV